MNGNKVSLKLNNIFILKYQNNYWYMYNDSQTDNLNYIFLIIYILGDSVRRTVYTVFTTVCGLGICLLFLLRKPRDPVRNEYNV